jgi:hypothetical protein
MVFLMRNDKGKVLKCFGNGWQRRSSFPYLDSQPWAQQYGTYLISFDPLDSLSYKYTTFYNSAVVFSPGLGKQVLFEYGFEHVNNYAITDYILSGDTTGTIYPESAFWPVSIDASSEKDFTISPNPIQSGQALLVNLPEHKQWNCSILSLNGAEILSVKKQGSQVELQIPELPMGIYLLELADNEGFVRRKKLFLTN